MSEMRERSALEVLRSVEWSGCPENDWASCPQCGGLRPTPFAPAGTYACDGRVGHYPDCALDAVLSCTPASDGGEVRERVEEILSEWTDLIGDSVESWGAVLPPSPAEIADRILALLSGSGTPPGDVVPAPLRWNQVEGRDGERYTAGWNACRDAMLAALRSKASGEMEIDEAALEEARERERALTTDAAASRRTEGRR